MELWVVFPITNQREMDLLKYQYQSYVLGVDAPVLTRHALYEQKYGEASFERFLEIQDEFEDVPILLA